MTAGPQLLLTALGGIPMLSPGMDLAQILLDALSSSGLQLRDGDLLAITSKIVSKTEGRFARLADVVPTPEADKVAIQCDKDPRLVQLILDESQEISRLRPGVLVVRHRLGFVCANAGIDRSNVGPASDDEELVLLLPVAPDRSAKSLRQRIEDRTGFRVGIVIADSHGRPHRSGAVGVAVGVAGLPALEDWRGRADLFGRPLETTTIGLADQIASAASLLFGEADEGTPVVHFRGLHLQPAEGTADQLVRPREMDLYR